MNKMAFRLFYIYLSLIEDLLIFQNNKTAVLKPCLYVCVKITLDIIINQLEVTSIFLIVYFSR